ncbi:MULTISPECIES: hypothetical protein [unclassified Microbulbifer]|uniref:hypothetical protein n=1 Tax=unclassified Microbulbifer TaxID=2619833 RepID=UPI0027E3DF9D|nr:MULTISPECIES: hypothetical protein [unclassified Microbulbifer]
MEITPGFIKKLCDDWVCAACKNGGISIGSDSEKYRLLANGVQFHLLDFDSLIASVLGLSKVILLPGMNSFVVQDHFGLWSWCGEVIAGAGSHYFEPNEREIKSLFEACIRASLTHCRKPAASPEEHMKQSEVEQQLPHNARYFLQDSSLILAYVSFPMLEAILKKTCSEYLRMDGSVKKQFQVMNRAKKPRTYKVSSLCSSIRDELFLLYEKVADKELKTNLDEFRAHISSLDSSSDPFDLIYEWRNQSLHGSSNFQTIGGTLLNLCILIALHSMKVEFGQWIGNILRRCERESDHGFRASWSFYPPY